MKLDIKNFNCIDNLTYEGDDHKVNFLFGISGSGKSSIAQSLENEPNGYNTKINAASNIEVLLNGANVDYSKVAVFNNQFLNNVLFNVNSSDIYKIIFSDFGNISSLRVDYENEINMLVAYKDEIYAFIQKIEDLEKTLNIQFMDKKLDLLSTCKIRKLKDNISKINSANKCASYSAKEIKWFKDGISMTSYSSDRCPFCNSKLSPTKKSVIKNISSFDISDYVAIENKTPIFSELGLTVPTFKNNSKYKNFLRDLKKTIEIKDELISYKDWISKLQVTDFQMTNLKTKRPSKNLKEKFPDICTAIDSFISNIKLIKQKLGLLKRETDKVINGHIKDLNENIKVLGIPYEFVKDNIDDDTKTASYILKHVDDSTSIDRKICLSNGEKNLIALLFFLISKADIDYMVIDDPASSFDEYRRKIILDLIYYYHKSSTVIVLSHDHVFAKFACYFYDKAVNSTRGKSDLLLKYGSDTGKIQLIENYNSSITLKDITVSDFKTIETAVLENIKNLGNNMNYQIAINLRLFFELRKSFSGCQIVYKYLSAIMHKIEYSVLIQQIINEGKTEDDILKVIESQCGISFNPLSANYIVEINIATYSMFEKILYSRELIKTNTKKKKAIFDELSTIVHLNNSYAVSLNPYKYNYFSKYVFDYLIEEKLI